MDMHATLRRSGGFDALSRHLGIPPAEVAAAASALLSPLLARFRAIFLDAGGGHAGIAAVSALLQPHGGSDLSFAILGHAPIAPERGQALIRVLCEDEAARAACLASARRASPVPAEHFAAVLPLLAMLAAGYVCARIETATRNGQDPVEAFEALFARPDKAEAE